MARFSFALAGVSALAIAALPAVAQAQGMAPIHGTAAVKYLNLDDNSGDADVWQGDVGVVYNGGLGLGAQSNFNYNTLEGPGYEGDVWGLEGALTYGFDTGKFAAGLSYSALDTDSYEEDGFNYGVAGEAYVENILTLNGRAGAVKGELFDALDYDGIYYGGGVSIYPMANLSVAASLDYVNYDFGDIHAYGLSAEFKPIEDLPVSIGGSYRRLERDGFFNIEADTFSFQLKAYLGTPGNGTLIENHRNGAVKLGNVTSLITGN